MGLLNLKGFGEGERGVFGAVPFMSRHRHLVFENAVVPMVRGYHWVRDDQGHVFRVRWPRRKIMGDARGNITHEREIGPEDLYKPSVMPDQYDAEVAVEPGENPHVAFYRAAKKLQSHLAMEAHKVGEEVALWDAQSVDLITVVYTPILATPLEDQGFYLSATVGMMAVESGAWESEAPPSSELGECPITPPGMIEMQMLMKLDEEVIAKGVDASNTRDLMQLFNQRVKTR